MNVSSSGANLSKSGPISTEISRKADSVSAKGKAGPEILFSVEPEPNLPPPDQKVTGPYWELDHYERKPGKTVGFWPGSGHTDWSTMRTKWGFSGIRVDPGQHQAAIDTGFNWKSMMVSVGPNDWQQVIDNYLSERYYSGEPIDHWSYPCVDCVARWTIPEWEGKLYLLPQIRAYANSHGADYIIDGMKRCDHMIDASNQVDGLMFSSYRHWTHPITCSWECWYPSGDDQRDDWTDMMRLFDGKFSSTWIAGHAGDTGDANGEIDNLCGHAANLGLQEIWLYCGGGVVSGRVESFCYSAWRWGWLRRFEREYYIWWKCIDPDGCDRNNPDGWVIDFREYTYQCQEVFPSGPPGPGYCTWN